MNSPILTPPVISTLPLGLLRYLGIQSGGRFPQTLSEVLVPTYELLDITQASTDRDFQEIVSVSAIGFNASTTLLISPAKVARASLVGIRMTTGVGQAVVFSIAVQGQSGVTHVLNASQSVAASSGAGSQFDRPLWMQPGDTLGVQCFAITAGPINMTVTLRKSDFFF